MNVLTTELDELVGNATKCVGEIEPGNVSCSLPFLCILDDFLKDFDVFWTSIDSLKKCFLMAGVDITILISAISTVHQ